uniref:PRKG1_interact domain-containing protein n=1 Tax=Elaeophora elaphi TaxID=1147741 RepID=A0A0R3S046_9BILA
MFKNLFRPRRSNKENEEEHQYHHRHHYQQQQQQQQHSANEFVAIPYHSLYDGFGWDRNLPSYKSLRNPREKRSFHSSHHHYRGNAGGGPDDGLSASTSPYHTATQRKYPRGTQSCHDGLSDEFDRFSSMNRSFASAAHSKYKPTRREYMNVMRRSHLNSEYGSCDPSLNTPPLYSRDLDDSDAETWNSERIIKELRAELRATNERKNYYKDLYKRERQDRMRDRELRDLVEKKLMDDLRNKELECSNNLLRIKALEQQLQHHSNFPPPIRESSFRIPHFCTPSSSNTASTMAGAGEALSSTSELFAIRGAYLINQTAVNTGIEGAANTAVSGNPGEMPDEMKVFRQPDELSLEQARNSSMVNTAVDVRCDNAAGISPNSLGVSFANRENFNGTLLEEDRQSDNGYGTTSECASELVRSIRRVHSDSEVPLKVIQT